MSRRNCNAKQIINNDLQIIESTILNINDKIMIAGNNLSEINSNLQNKGIRGGALNVNLDEAQASLTNINEKLKELGDRFSMSNNELSNKKEIVQPEEDQDDLALNNDSETEDLDLVPVLLDFLAALVTLQSIVQSILDNSV